MQPSTEWLKAYESKRSLLACPADLSAYFTESRLFDKDLVRLSLGKLLFPTGQIYVRDPLVWLRRNEEPYWQGVPPGEYDVDMAVVTASDGDCDRYAAVRVRFSGRYPVRYEEALVGTENLASLTQPGQFFGFRVDAGLGCVCDAAAKDAFIKFSYDWHEENGYDANIYENYFSDLFIENKRRNPAYQRDLGDWLNWRIPGSSQNIILFAAGFGDGSYPAYYGYDVLGEICCLVVHLIDIETEYDLSDEYDEYDEYEEYEEY